MQINILVTDKSEMFFFSKVGAQLRMDINGFTIYVSKIYNKELHARKIAFFFLTITFHRIITGI